MTEEEVNKLKFRWKSHMTLEDCYSTIYECDSEPLKGRLFVNKMQNRDKNTGFARQGTMVHYSLDGKLYRSKKKFLEAIKNIELPCEKEADA